MPDTSNPSTPRSGSGTRHQAGWFDIRNVIGLLLLLYGLVLLGLGIFDSDGSETVGVNANLWVGLGILAVGIFFVVWARVRPIVVDEAELARQKAAQENEPPAH